jgi:hypothetical protein
MTFSSTRPARVAYLRHAGVPVELDAGTIMVCGARTEPHCVACMPLAGGFRVLVLDMPLITLKLAGTQASCPRLPVGAHQERPEPLRNGHHDSVCGGDKGSCG